MEQGTMELKKGSVENKLTKKIRELQKSANSSTVDALD